MIFVLQVPVLSGYLEAVLIVLLLTFASLGVGLLISLVADSERMAVQLAMLVLLASVFFSGFVLPVQDFIGPVQYLAYLLPVTHGIAMLQDAMLRGTVDRAVDDRRAGRDRRWRSTSSLCCGMRAILRGAA